MGVRALCSVVIHAKKKKRKIIVAADVYPCPCPCPYLRRRCHRRYRNSATTCQTSPRRRVIPQSEPWDRRHAAAKAGRARRTVPATRPSSPTRLEKQIGPGHRRTNHGDGDDDDRRSEIQLCEKRCRPRCHSRRVGSAWRTRHAGDACGFLLVNWGRRKEGCRVRRKRFWS